LSTDLLALLALPPGPACVAVACSGGRDSIALLHATASAAQHVPGLAVVALHVHHGLSPQADAWAAHVVAQCGAWAAQGLPVRAVVQRVNCDLAGGRSVEAAAREARYAALAHMACEQGAAMVLLAHHRRDQAETFLLQALRGAGVAGLAAMPDEALREGVLWVRPWLGVAREAIEAYVRDQRIPFIDDDSNDDTRFARNRLRHQVWPPLVQAFPQAEQALADAARRLADTQHVLDVAVAAQVRGLCSVAGGAGGGGGGGDLGSALREERAAELGVAGWCQLDGPHRRLTLMHWYRQCAGAPLPATWVDRLADELPQVWRKGEPASWPPVGLGLYRGRLHWQRGMAEQVAQIRSNVQGASEPMQDWFGAKVHTVATSPATEASVCLDLLEVDEIALPQWGGVLRVQAVTAQGVPRASLQGLSLRARSGGESFQLGPQRPARALRKQYQQQAVPAWCRGGPLVWRSDQLLFVPGLGMDARCWAPEDEPQWKLVWQPDKG
jgi:tRNA(Ile)-lysidine synthase